MSESHAAATPPAPGRPALLASWKFWVVMAVIAALTGLFVYGFTVDPKLVKSPLVQRPAPGFSLTELNSGEPLSLESLRGTPILLNFWASWCAACREEAHLLEAAHRRWGQDPKRFRVVGIAIQDTPEAARKFAKRFGKTYYLALDNAAGDISLNYGLYGVPESFLIDASGTIRYKQIGALTEKVLGEQIPLLLASREQRP
jgi:cytochrome c biogenesis protein CcmG/thiol:disulfide interchange protein DsbE